MAFQRYRHIESTVTAAQMGSETVPYIIERIMREVSFGLLNLYTQEVAFGDAYTLTFQYKNSDVVYTLTDGMYLMELNDGSLYAASAEDFAKSYEWVEPSAIATVGTGVVGKARLVG